MNNKIYILLAVLLLLASLSSFVINVKGDAIATNEVQPLAFPITGEDVLYVYPSSVPRYCDVFVKTYPDTEVKVYRINGQDTGIKCTTNNEGECTFNFGMKESKGLYYAQAQNITTNLYLDTTKECDITYKSDRLEILPGNITLEAGNEFTFDVNSYLVDQLINSSKDYNLSDTFRATIIDSNNTNVKILVTGAGEVELIAYSGKQIASSQITIVPNTCSLFHELSMSSNFFAGQNISQSYLIMDAYGNLKSNEIVLCTITLPNGTVDSFNLTSDVNGVILLEYPVTLTGSYNVEINSYNPEHCGQSGIGNFPEVLPDVTTLDVKLMRGEQELNDTVSMYVDDEFAFRFIAVDGYSNVLNENSYTCLINSSDSNIFEYLSGDTWNEYRILSGHLTGEANLTYVCYLGTSTEPFENNYTTIVTTGNLNHPGAIYVVSPPTELRAGENSTLELVLLDSYGYVIEDEVVYNFSTLFGEIINNTYYAPTDLGGEVLLVDEINVSYGDVNTTIQINIIPNVPYTLELISSIFEIEQNQSFTLFVIVKDEYNNSIPNVEINFSIVEGPATLNENSAFTNNSGIVSVNGLSGNTNGTVVYSASYNDIIVFGEFNVLELTEPKIPITIVCEAVPENVYLNENVTITCTIYDQESLPLQDVMVDFVSTGGILSSSNGITSDTGRVSVNFNSENAGIFVINASTGIISTLVNVNVQSLENSGILLGNVLNQSLNPVDGTIVKVLLNGIIIETINVDEFGNFNFELQPGIYDVIVESPGYLTHYEYGLVVVSEQTVVRNYVLTTLSRLSGTITNQTSDLIEGATVEIYRNNKLVETMTTTSDGKYSFTVASGIYTIKVKNDDYMISYFSVYLPLSTEVEKNVVIYR